MIYYFLLFLNLNWTFVFVYLRYIQYIFIFIYNLRYLSLINSFMTFGSSFCYFLQFFASKFVILYTI